MLEKRKSISDKWSRRE